MTKSAPTSDPTPRWRRIQCAHPEAHAALQRAAEALYERTEEPVDAGGTEADLHAAAELGLLEGGDEGLPEAIKSANFAQTAFGVRTAWENRIQRYRETAEVRAEEFGSHLDDTILDDGIGC